MQYIEAIKVCRDKINNVIKFKTDHYYYLLLLVFPFILLLANNGWIFPNAYIAIFDDWIYLGYFLNFAQYVKLFDQPWDMIYFGSRLPWILPGYALYHIFSPKLANYILHLSFFYASLFSLYLVLKINFNRRTAIFTSILMGSYGYFLWEIGYDYITGAVITYFFLTLLMITLAARSLHGRHLLGLSGVFYACMVLTNLTALIFTPAIFIYYYSSNYIYQKKPLIRSLIFFAIGCISITLLFMIINYLLVDRFIFFMPQINAMFYWSNALNPWFDPNYQNWIFGSLWLILPSLVTIGCLAFFISSRNRQFSNQIISKTIFQYIFIIIFVILILGQIYGRPFLQLFYYADYLIPVMFLALGSQISIILTYLTKHQFRFLLFFEIIVFVLPMAFINHANLMSMLLDNKSFVFYIFLLSWFCFLFVENIQNIKKIHRRTLFAALLVLCATFGITNPLLLMVPGTSSPVILKGDIDTIENGYSAVMESVLFIRNIVPDDRVLFWYNAKETNNNSRYFEIFQSISSVYLACYNWFGTDFPELIIQHLPDNHHIVKLVILSTRENAFELANESLNKIGIDIKFVAKKNVTVGKISFNTILVEIHNTDDNSFLSDYNDQVLTIYDKNGIKDVLNLSRKFPFLTRGFLGIEDWSGTPTSWMQGEATILVNSSENHTAILSLRAISFYSNRTLEIYKGDELLTKAAIPTKGFVEIEASIHLVKGINALRLRVLEGCERPSDIKELNSIDNRCLSVAFQNVALGERKSSQLEYLKGFYDTEIWSGTQIRWMQSNAALLVNSSDNRTATLSLQAQSFYRNRTLEISSGGTPAAQVAVPTSFIKVSVPIQIAKGANVVRLRVPESCERPNDKPVLNNPDTRCLSMAVQNIAVV